MLRTTDWPDNQRDDGAKLRTPAEVAAIRSIIAQIQSGAPFKGAKPVTCNCWMRSGEHTRPIWLCCACNQFHQFADYVDVCGTSLTVSVNLGCSKSHDGRWNITYRDTGHTVGGYLDDLTGGTMIVEKRMPPELHRDGSGYRGNVIVGGSRITVTRP